MEETATEHGLLISKGEKRIEAFYGGDRTCRENDRAGLASWRFLSQNGGKERGIWSRVCRYIRKGQCSRKIVSSL